MISRYQLGKLNFYWSAGKGEKKVSEKCVNGAKEAPEPNLFHAKDYDIVRSAVARLPKVERLAITLRFWEHYTLDEVAQELGVTWREVEDIIAKALVTLRQVCIGDPRFSRTKPSGGESPWQAQTAMLIPKAA